VDARSGKGVSGAAINLCTANGLHRGSMYRRKRDPSDKRVSCGVGGCGGPASPYTYEEIVSDENGLVMIEHVQNTDGTLHDLTAPYVAWILRDEKGRVVYPGGQAQDGVVVETGEARLYGDSSQGYELRVIAPGRYTTDWEIHNGYEGDLMPRPICAAVSSGRAEFEVKRAAKEIVVLAK